MGKKPTLSPRMPPTPEELDRRTQFVASGSVEAPSQPTVGAVAGVVPASRTKRAVGAKTSRRPDAQASMRHKAVQLRADGREVRRHTIYLSVPLAKALAHYCVEHDTEMSAVVAEAVSHHLENERR